MLRVDALSDASPKFYNFIDEILTAVVLHSRWWGVTRLLGCSTLRVMGSRRRTYGHIN